MFGNQCLCRTVSAEHHGVMFGQHIVDRDRERLIADLDFLRMEELPRPTPERTSAWRMLRIQTAASSTSAPRSGASPPSAEPWEPTLPTLHRGVLDLYVMATITHRVRGPSTHVYPDGEQWCSCVRTTSPTFRSPITRSTYLSTGRTLTGSERSVCSYERWSSSQGSMTVCRR